MLSSVISPSFFRHSTLDLRRFPSFFRHPIPDFRHFPSFFRHPSPASRHFPSFFRHPRQPQIQISICIHSCQHCMHTVYNYLLIFILHCIQTQTPSTIAYTSLDQRQYPLSTVSEAYAYKKGQTPETESVLKIMGAYLTIRGYLVHALKRVFIILSGR